MSLSLPPVNHPARALFDVAHLAEVASPSNRGRLATLQTAKASARETMAKSAGIRSITSFVLRANGHLHLMTFGPRGGHTVQWDFGAL